nr:myosin heavy chain-related protein [Tanacetum cinerariifolium]
MKISDLNVSVQEKDLIITALTNNLRKLKRKALVDDAVTSHSIALKMLKVDMEPLAPKLLNNRTTHSDYLRHTQEQAAILRGVVEKGKSQFPLNNSLDHACKYTKSIQELLIIIRQTCPCINNLSDKSVVVTPMNKTKRVRFIEPVTSSGNTNTKTTSSSNLVSNKPALSSTGVKPSTSASGSQPSGNNKKDKIQQPPSSTQKNKVQAYPRTVKSSLKIKSCAVEPKGTAFVQHSKLNANSKFIGVKCNGCMLYDNHDLCVLYALNARVKSRSVKKNTKRKVWKPTGKTINETADTITSLQSEVASHDAKWPLDANEEIKKDHTRIHELEKQVEKLPMELQLKNNFMKALETTSKNLEKKMLDLNPMLHDPQKVIVDQKKKHYKPKYALKIDDDEFKKAKSEATTKIRKLAKEEYGISESKEFLRHHLEEAVGSNPVD